MEGYYFDESSPFERVVGEIKCGRHSGFSWCCVLWYILPWKLVLRYSKWDDNNTWYHKLMDKRPPRTKMTDLRLSGKEGKTYDDYTITGYRKITISDYGMIPCPLHLWRRKRNQVLTCFCGSEWLPEVKAKVLKEHPELCVKG